MDTYSGALSAARSEVAPLREGLGSRLQDVYSQLGDVNSVAADARRRVAGSWPEASQSGGKNGPPETLHDWVNMINERVVELGVHVRAIQTSV